MAASGSSWIELKSDGTPNGTKLYLVLRAYDGGELRHEIPFVTEVQWSCEAGPNKPKQATLQLRLTSVRADVVAPLGTGKTTVEDLIAEIAAHRLAREPDDTSKFVAEEQTALPGMVSIVIDEYK
jgi:hypothetical protein